MPDQTLTITPDGRCYPSRELCRRLDLRGGQHLDIIPPRTKGGGAWHLDFRPLGPTSKLTASPNRRPQFRTGHRLYPSHFRRAAGPGRTWQEVPRLKLAPAEEVAPGFWRLVPVSE